MSMTDKEKRSIQNLVPYTVAPRDEDQQAIYLDANENPYPREYRLSNKYFNRYPEPQPKALLESYAKYVGVQPENLLVSLGEMSPLSSSSKHSVMMKMQFYFHHQHLACMPLILMLWALKFWKHH